MRLKVLCLHHTRISVKRSREIDYSLGQSIVFSYFKPLLTSISMKPFALNSYSQVFLVSFPFSPKYQKSNETNQCGSVLAKYLRPPLKVVYIDRSGHFCRLDCRNVPIHLTRLLFPLPLICMILFASTITKNAMACVGSVQPECTVPLGTWNSWDFKPQFLSHEKRPFLLAPGLSSELQGFGGMPSSGNAPQKPA